MRLRAALTGVLAVTLAVVGVWIFKQQQTPNAVKIELSSDPFPMAAGRTTMLVSLTDSQGAPIDNAAVEVTSTNPNNPIILPLKTRTNTSVNGIYAVPIIWPGGGAWTVDVKATLPGEERTVRERFDVFVFVIPQESSSPRVTYPGVSELDDYITDPARELQITIPMGTGIQMLKGHGDDVIPSEIRLKLDGQHVLIVRNDDIVDHSVGPFFVRAGEIIRQEFTRPATYQGACSIRHDTVVNIIVEA